MNLGALEKPIIQTMAKDLAKNILDNNDITVVTTLNTAGKIIAYLDKYEGQYVNYCEDTEDLTPVIITKIDFQGREYLYLENLLFEDGKAKEVEYDSTTVYLDYNINFVALPSIFDTMVEKGALVVNFN